MSDREKNMAVQEEENSYEYQSETDNEEEQAPNPPPPVKGQRTMQRAKRQQPQQQSPPNYGQVNGYQNNQLAPVQEERLTGNMGGRTGAIRESRIKDRPQPKEVRDSSLKIKIELDLEVEVDLYARVKGDVTIGLL